MTATAGAPPPIERRRMALLSRLPLRGNRRAESGGDARVSDPRLTPRQRQVLDGLIRGLTNKEIGAELGIGPDAVKRVVSRLLVKLDAPSRTALVQLALQTEAARRRRSQVPNALSLLDAAPIPALVTRGGTHRIEFANAAAKLVLADAAPGMALADLWPAVPWRAMQRAADDCLGQDVPRIARNVGLHDGAPEGARWRRVDVFMTPMHDGLGKVAGLVVFLVDTSRDPASGRIAASDSSERHRARPA